MLAKGQYEGISSLMRYATGWDTDYTQGISLTRSRLRDVRSYVKALEARSALSHSIPRDGYREYHIQ